MSDSATKIISNKFKPNNYFLPFFTTQMRAELQTQLTRLQSGQNRLEQEIPQLQRELENAQLDQLTLKRDQSLGLYTDLLETQQQIATALTQSSQVASVSVQAVPPEKALSRKTLMNTALAGMLGLMLSVFGGADSELEKKRVGQSNPSTLYFSKPVSRCDIYYFFYHHFCNIYIRLLHKRMSL